MFKRKDADEIEYYTIFHYLLQGRPISPAVVCEPFNYCVIDNIGSCLISRKFFRLQLIATAFYTYYCSIMFKTIYLQEIAKANFGADQLVVICRG